MSTQSCDACPQTYCQKLASSKKGTGSSTSTSTSSSNTGAIVGGVVGGLVAILAVIALIWWFYIRPKKAKIQLSSHKALADNTAPNGPEYDNPFEKQQHLSTVAEEPALYMDNVSQNNSRSNSRSGTQNNSPNPSNIPYDRNTTFSQHSISTSSLTRSSNVIPIAYIPGVTTRAAISPSLQPNVYESPMIDRSSIASENYRGSTALITATTMTAVQARPNLVELGSSSGGGSNTSNASTHSVLSLNDGDDIRSSQISDIQHVQYVQATPTIQRINRMNAHSITIGGKSSPALGLQSEYIPEEDESFTTISTSITNSNTGSDLEDNKADNFNKTVAATFSTPPSRSLIPKSSESNNDISNNERSRPPSSASTVKAGSLSKPLAPFSNVDRLNSSRVSQASSFGSFLSFKSALEPKDIPESPTNNTITSATPSRRNTRTSVLSSATRSIAGDDYVADLPIEAVLYARSQDDIPNNTESTVDATDVKGKEITSPFDDRFQV